MARKQPEPDPLLGVPDLCEEFGVTRSAIYKWRERKTGPKGFKIGRYVKYRRSEVNRWLAEQGDTAARERTM